MSDQDFDDNDYDGARSDAGVGEDGAVPDSGMGQHPSSLSLPGAFRGLNFKILGYNHENFFYFPYRGRQIVTLKAPEHTLPNLLRLDQMHKWEAVFRPKVKDSEGILKPVSEKRMVLYAMDMMLKTAQEKGVFKEEDSVRGCGAWMDAGRAILHCGDKLYVDGTETGFDGIKSDYTYVASVKFGNPAAAPLSNKDAMALRTVCEKITFENKLSGALLAGWLVVAPICGALTYRPHIFLTGESQSGKSTVANNIIKPVIGKIALNVDGGTTEPAIRNMMEYDARPLIYDEAEPSQNMLNVIELARKASTRTIIKKFGQRPFAAQFCACFVAINPAISKTADENRTSLLVIKKNKKATAIQDYDELLKMIDELITPDFSERMMTRTIMYLPTLLANIKIFKRAVRKIIKDARGAEQIGTLLAGVYFLGRTDEITIEAAEEWVKERDWSEFTTIKNDSDPMRLIQHISTALIRFTPQSGSSYDVLIGDLIRQVYEDDDQRSDKFLRYYGIVINNHSVIFANKNQNLAKLLKNTDWEIKWNRALSDVVGAKKMDGVYFSTGLKTSAVSIPIEHFCARKPMSLADVEETL